jgi:putative phage-type endonuclease
MTLDWLSQNDARKESESVQGSEAWKKWRSKGLGGSDSAALFGWSPYKTVKQLWSEKLGRTVPVFGPFQQAAMDRGKRLEPIIRKRFEEIVGVPFTEKTEEHKEFSFIRASYDGIHRTFKNEDGSVGRILEIKTANQKDHAMAKAGEVPLKYLTQLNWMGLVAGISWFDYVSYGSDGTYERVTLKADPLIQEELLKRAKLLWKCIEEKTEPTDVDFPYWIYPLKAPLDLSGSEEQVAEQETEALVAEALKFQEEMNAAEARFDAAKEKLKKVLGDREKMQCGEAIFGWQIRKGSVDYGKIPALETIDLEPYRKGEVKAFYFKRAK